MRRALRFVSLLFVVAGGLAQEPASVSDVADRPQLHTIFAVSKTVYLKDEQLRQALMACPALQRSGASLTALSDDADVLIEVHRPFLTFDWTYTVTQRGALLASGKVVAFDGAAAAPKLAESIGQALYGPSAPSVKQTFTGAARYRGGTLDQVTQGGRVRLTLAGEQLQIMYAGGPNPVVYAAPAASVTVGWQGIRKIRHSAADKWWDFWTLGEASKQRARGEKVEKINFSCDAEDCIGALMWVPVVLGTGEVLELFGKEAHVIALCWVDGGDFHRADFEMSGQEMKQFLIALRTANPQVVIPPAREISLP